MVGEKPRSCLRSIRHALLSVARGIRGAGQHGAERRKCAVRAVPCRAVPPRPAPCCAVMSCTCGAVGDRTQVCCGGVCIAVHCCALLCIAVQMRHIRCMPYTAPSVSTRSASSAWCALHCVPCTVSTVGLQPRCSWHQEMPCLRGLCVCDYHTVSDEPLSGR